MVFNDDFISPPSTARWRAFVMPMLVFKCSLLMVYLETNYLRMYWISLYQVFRIGPHVDRHDQYDLFADRSRDVARVTDFWCESVKIGISTFIVCWHFTTDGRITTWMPALTLTNFECVFAPGGPHAGLCHVFLVANLKQRFVVKVNIENQQLSTLLARM